MSDPKEHDETVTLRSGGPPGAEPFKPSGPVVVDQRYYRRKEELACGGMGQTFTAVDSRLGRRVVLKELRPPGTDDPPGVRDKLRGRLQQEARILAGLVHPNIVTVYEAGQWPNGEPFYAMRHVQGRELRDVVELEDDLEQRLRLLPSIIAVAEAAAYAHSRGVVHRDLTPKNILIGEYGDAVVIDWGISKVIDEAETSLHQWEARSDGMTAAGMGVPAYAPPEQIAGNEPDERCDIYSLGGTLHFLLSGAAPFLGDSIEQILGRVVRGERERLPSGIPGELQAIVDKAMAVDPEQRYANAGELAGELKAFQAGGLVLAHRYSAVEHARKWISRRWMSLVVVVALAATVAAAVGVRYFQRQSRLAQQQSVAAESKKAAAEKAQNRSDKLRHQADDAAQQAGKTAAAADHKAAEARRRAEALRKSLAATRKQRASALRSRTRALALAKQERELKDAAQKAKAAAVTAATEAQQARAKSQDLAAKANAAQKQALKAALSAQQTADQAASRAKNAEAAASVAQKQAEAARLQARADAKKLEAARADLARHQQLLKQERARLKQEQVRSQQCQRQRAEEGKTAAETQRRLSRCEARKQPAKRPPESGAPPPPPPPPPAEEGKEKDEPKP